MKTLKERYLYLIKEKDVTPYEVAKNTGIENSTLSHIKNGTTKGISNANAKLLAEYFGVNKDWLKSGEGEMRSQNINSSFNDNKNHGTLLGSNVIGNIDLSNVNEVLEISKRYQKIISEFQSYQQQFLDIISNLTKK
jgi:transcriptional regulator with XRE-family HTH domain